MGSVAIRKYKDPIDRGVLCSDISLWAVWPPEDTKTTPDRGVVCSDISLWAVWPLENIETSSTRGLYVGIYVCG